MQKKRTYDSDSDSSSGSASSPSSPPSRVPKKKVKASDDEFIDVTPSVNSVPGQTVKYNEQNEAYLPIGPDSSKRRVTVRMFRKNVYIDIREFYEADGIMRPGKKGISLTREQWADLKTAIPAIDRLIATLK